MPSLALHGLAESLPNSQQMEATTFVQWGQQMLVPSWEHRSGEHLRTWGLRTGSLSQPVRWKRGWPTFHPLTSPVVLLVVAPVVLLVVAQFHQLERLRWLARGTILPGHRAVHLLPVHELRGVVGT